MGRLGMKLCVIISLKKVEIDLQFVGTLVHRPFFHDLGLHHLSTPSSSKPVTNQIHFVFVGGTLAIFMYYWMNSVIFMFYVEL